MVKIQVCNNFITSDVWVKIKYCIFINFLAIYEICKNRYKKPYYLNQIVQSNKISIHLFN